MKLFKADNSDTTQLMAKPLAQGMNCSEVIDFNKKSANPFQGQSIQDFTSIALLAHANRKEYGDYTVNSFVKRFKKDFDSAFSRNQRAAINDIYLIGCEAGLSVNGNKAWAQQLADAMQKAGFHNVMVHAIANPQQSRDEQHMAVEVVDTQRDGVTVNAWTMNNGEENSYRHLEKQVEKAYKNLQETTVDSYDDIKTYRVARNNAKKKYKQLNKQFSALKDQLFKNQGALFFKERAEDVLFWLNTPNNTFHPNTHSQRRVLHYSHEQKIAMQKIHARVKQTAYSTGRHKAATHNVLSNLLDALVTTDADDWKKHVASAKNNLPKKRGTSAKMLNEIMATNPASTNASSSNKQRESAPLLSASDDRDDDRASVSDSDNCMPTMEGTRIDNSARRETLLIHAQAGWQSHVAFDIQNTALNQGIDAAIQYLTSYIRLLEQERQQHHKVSLFGHLGNYKQRKMIKLRDALRGDEVDDVKSTVKDFYNSSSFFGKRLLTMGKTHRAENVLKNLANGETDKDFTQSDEQSLKEALQTP